MKALVVYYSITGSTKELAEQLAKSMGADCVRIDDGKSRKGLFGFIASGYQAGAKKTVKITPIVGVETYDVVVVCTPIWAGSMSSPVRSFLAQYGKTIRQTAYVLLHGDKTNPYEACATEMDAYTAQPHKGLVSLCTKATPETKTAEVERLTALLKAF